MIEEEEEKMKKVQDRERSMRQLESDIRDVNTIFKDLATMTHVDKKAGLIKVTGKEVTELLWMKMPYVRFIMVSKIESMLQSNGIPTIVVHHNALLREHIENGHKFSPDQVLENMRVMADLKVHQLNMIKMELMEEQVMRCRACTMLYLGGQRDYK